MVGQTLADWEAAARNSGFGPLFLAVAVAVVLLAVFLIWRMLRRRSGPGIERVMRSLAKEWLHDVMIPDGVGGRVHLDYLLLTAAGLVAVEVRDYRGTIFAGERTDHWTQVLDNRSYRFENPLYLNQTQVLAVKGLAGKAPVYGCVVFTRAAAFPKGMPANVVYLDQLGEQPPFATGPPAGAMSQAQLAWQGIRQSVTRPV